MRGQKMKNSNVALLLAAMSILFGFLDFGGRDDGVIDHASTVFFVGIGLICLAIERAEERTGERGKRK